MLQKIYMAVLLESYAELHNEPIPDNLPVEIDYCAASSNKEIKNGPSGCSSKWVRYNGYKLPDEITLDGKTKKN